MKRKIPSDSEIVKCKNVRDLPIVKVDWLDASARGGWDPLSSYRSRDVVKIQSVGRLTRNTRKSVQLMQNFDEHNGVSDSMSIPKSCVVKMTVIGK